MEKYTGAKTIGDGTYGSVLKAINKQNGKLILALCGWTIDFLTLQKLTVFNMIR